MTVLTMFLLFFDDLDVRIMPGLAKDTRKSSKLKTAEATALASQKKLNLAALKASPRVSPKLNA